MTYRHALICLIRSGLLQRVVQLPIMIDVDSKEEEGIIRLCLKLIISLIFKGQNARQTAEYFKNGASLSEFESIFRQQGITGEGEMLSIL